MDDTMRKIHVLHTVVSKMMETNRPTDILIFKLDQLEKLVMSIPGEQANLAQQWAQNLAVHWSGYVLLQSSPPLPSLPVMAPTCSCHSHGQSSLIGKPSDENTVHFKIQNDHTLVSLHRPTLKRTINTEYNTLNGPLSQISKRPRFISNPKTTFRGQLRAKLVAILDATRSVTDDDDMTGLKCLLRAVSSIVEHISMAFMQLDDALQAELFQIAFNKLPETIRAYYYRKVSPAEITSKDLRHFKYFIKNQINFLLCKIIEENKIVPSTSHSYGPVVSNSITCVPVFCSFCNSHTNHSKAQCPVLKIAICFYCLEDGHFIRNCPKSLQNRV